MNCPTCKNLLTPIDISGTTIDFCNQGCGGIWFDAGELENFDEPSEPIDENYLVHHGILSTLVDRSKELSCPRCDNQKLIKKIEDAEMYFELDHCPGCSGVWVDPGELLNLREHYGAKKERLAEINKFLDSHSSYLATGDFPQKVFAIFRLIF
jgi:Zn-finger nucleic acid-binding protein